MFHQVTAGLAFRLWSGEVLLALSHLCPGCSDRRLLQYWAASIAERSSTPPVATDVAVEVLNQFERRVDRDWLTMAEFGTNPVWQTVDTILGHTVPVDSVALRTLSALAEMKAEEALRGPVYPVDYPEGYRRPKQNPERSLEMGKKAPRQYFVVIPPKGGRGEPGVHGPYTELKGAKDFARIGSQHGTQPRYLYRDSPTRGQLVRVYRGGQRCWPTSEAALGDLLPGERPRELGARWAANPEDDTCRQCSVCHGPQENPTSWGRSYRLSEVETKEVTKYLRRNSGHALDDAWGQPLQGIGIGTRVRFAGRLLVVYDLDADANAPRGVTLVLYDRQDHTMHTGVTLDELSGRVA